MYTPPAFAHADLADLHRAIRAQSLGTLITAGPGGPMVTPLPFMVDPDDGPKGALIAHLARANPQWRELAAGTPALAFFLGPNAYISPSHYATKQETGKVVPTWNYLAIEARGPVRMVEDALELRAIVARLTATHEAPRADPWAVDDAPEPFVQSQLKGIVGLVMRIEQLQGKWKMSQNRPPADRAGVLAGLEAEGEPGTLAVAEVMRGVAGR